jgi:hypothetical protein
LDFEGRNVDVLAASTLLLVSGVTTLTPFGFLMLLALAALRMFSAEDEAVSGGLGGARGAVAARGASPPRPRSVVFGVYSDSRGLTTSSLDPTASLLCAFEKVGYELPRSADAPDARRCISGTTEAILLPVDDCDTVLYAFSRLEPSFSLSLSLSLLDEDDDEVLLRVLPELTLLLLLGCSRSRSRSTSRSRSRSRSRSPSLTLERVFDFFLRLLLENIMAAAWRMDVNLSRARGGN